VSRPQPRSFARADLQAAGFAGWRAWAALVEEGFASVPDVPACLLFHRPSSADPVFVDDPAKLPFHAHHAAIPRDVLAANWVPGAHTLYITRAEAAAQRLTHMARFATGELPAHWGGRLLWQLADFTELLVAWHPITWDEPAAHYERRLLAQFARTHDGRRPYANHRGRNSNRRLGRRADRAEPPESPGHARR
jgi:hypothetical protein